MVGTTAQLAALACQFNGHIRGLRTDALFLSNSTALFCEYIHFVRRRRTWLGMAEEWAVLASTPEDWLAREARSGRSAILTHDSIDDPRMPDRKSAGFIGGGGRWLLNLVSDGRRDVWEPRWLVGDRKAAERRIWRVSYALLAQNAAMPATLAVPDALIPVLNQTLSQLVTFCDDNRLENFGACFRKAQDCLTADDPLALVYHKDLAPEGLLDLSARRLLAACQAAWVFGGMGSWNDLGIDGIDGSRYAALSNDLFTQINNGICSSVNSAA